VLKNSSSVLTAQTTNAESNLVNTEKTSLKDMSALIDECFYIERQIWGTYVSFDKDGTPLVTSMDEEQCLNATRFYLKGRQEGFTEDNSKTYESSVGGKL
jgi:hypothetical protein